MSKRPSLHWENQSPLHEHISIRNEYVGFVCMFCLFAFLGLFVTIVLAMLAYDAHYHKLEEMQRRAIPYAVLGAISLLLFLIFVIGWFGYTCKVLRHPRSKRTFTPPLPRPRQGKRPVKELISTTTTPSEESDVVDLKAKMLSAAHYACQTDV